MLVMLARLIHLLMQNIFLHVSELQKIGLTDIKEGEKLSFELANVKGKIVAIDIKLI
jgi:cold shock CspA family protein